VCSSDLSAKYKPVAKGLPASPGAASGTAVFSADEAEIQGKKGKKVILIGVETTPEDIHGIVMSQGVFTSRGGMTCHAAVVARGMGIPAVVGCEVMVVDPTTKQFRIGDLKVKEGDMITIDGSSGNVVLGELPMVDPKLTGEALKLLSWADSVRKLGVRANADTPDNAKSVREFGAEGIGLCRTESMFNAPDRLPIVREMILAKDIEGRKKALEKLLVIQRSDFKGILKAMEGLPVIIRLLDPPLHEFLPTIEDLILEIGKLNMERGDERVIKEKEELLLRVKDLHEFNPMLGHRGCRLGIKYPEIYEMQVQAILEAALDLKKEKVNIIPEIMIPLVGNVNEFKILRDRVKAVADDVMKKKKETLNFMIGTMIELPRACLTADEIAQEAEFFSFGTNDLTQTTLGFSRDDAEAKFLQQYLDQKILDSNPFEVIDVKGVGKLVEMAVQLGRKSRPSLEIGICGETGGEPISIAFYHNAGLDYVSCSKFRLPIARLAAAQAQIKNPRK
jgi:pyruvate,orthophosphate dikinase